MAVARYPIAPCHSQSEPHGAKDITLQSVSHEPFRPDLGGRATGAHASCSSARAEGKPHSERLAGIGAGAAFPLFTRWGCGSSIDLPSSFCRPAGTI